MAEEVTLAQLATEIAHLRQQVEMINQRLDMIYGAVTRLADQTTPAKTSPPQPTASPQKDLNLSPAAMMDPGSMLDSLHQFATESGLNVSKETVERLKGTTAQPPADE